MRTLAFSLLLLAAASAGAQQPPPQQPPAQPEARSQRDERPAQERREREAEQEQRDELADDRRRLRGAGPALEVTWRAPDALRDLFRQFIVAPPLPEGERRRAALRPWIREVRRKVPEMAAAEGYFSPSIDIEFNEARTAATVTVAPGERTTVAEVEIRFAGALAEPGPEREARREALRKAWAMKSGAPFRSADWESAKAEIEESLREVDYAAGRISESRAVVDAPSARARLQVTLDSGPPFTLGSVQIHGLDEYPEAVVRRVVDLREGERYSAERLADLQHSIQQGPWFSSVVVDVERDRARHVAVPVHVTVTENPSREIGLAIGYGTDDGARIETAYRDRNFLDRGFDLQSSIRAGQERQIGYADVYFPPGLFGIPKRGQVPFRDSVGVLVERSTIENLDLSRFAVAGYRHFTLDTWELRAGLSYQIERSEPEGAERRIKRALAPNLAVTWRTVDNLFDPQRGGVLNVQVAAAHESILSSQTFVKLYGQYQHWITFTPRDQVLLRTELGSTLADSRVGIPEDFLFRAGGSRSNRGYSYQSLGPREGDAVVGGRYMATASAEYIRWFKPPYGAAVFLDVGDAADSSDGWEANPSYGIGARYKTPAGPFALDLAYAER